MAEFHIKPDSKKIPSAPHLMEELHRVGVPVEINVKGKADQWDAVRFSEPGPPEIECFASFDPEDGTFTVSLPHDAPLAARELQLFITNEILKEVGGQVDNTTTREHFSAAQFAAMVRDHHLSKNDPWDRFWLVFSWAVVLFGLFLYFSLSSSLRTMDLTIVGLALISAIGLTFTKLRS